MKKLLEDLNIKNTIITGGFYPLIILKLTNIYIGKNKIRVNPFEDLKSEDIEWF